LPQLTTRTRILVLQHPREQRVAIGTARMAHLCLPGSQLRVGIDFSRDPVVADFLNGAQLLYPVAGPAGDPKDVSELPRDREINVVLVDGTWSQAKKLVRLNPEIAALPRVSFRPRVSSQYRIRREPADFYVSTIEALAELLTLREPENGPFDALLDPFRLMVDHQVRFANEIHSARHKKEPRIPRDPRQALAERLRADGPRLVCLHGDANGWPARHPDWQPAELLHLVAVRPATGERFQSILAPRRPLEPETAAHTGLPHAQLQAGVSVEACRQAWSAFRRADDVLVHWGNFHVALAEAEGIALPRRRFDLRGELTQASLREAGATIEKCAGGAWQRQDSRALSRLNALLAILEAIGR
jgi:DTW domain-containing protein YfiP